MSRFKLPASVMRVDIGLYAEMERAIIAHAGMDSAEALKILDAALSQIRLAAEPEWHDDEHPCGHAYLNMDGTWDFCVESGEHDSHRGRDAECWMNDAPRNVDLRSF